jgi:hypothetical protein
LAQSIVEYFHHAGTNAIMGNTAAMLIGVNFSTEGCWELSVYHAGHVLTFVVSVGL